MVTSELIDISICAKLSYYAPQNWNRSDKAGKARQTFCSEAADTSKMSRELLTMGTNSHAILSQNSLDPNGCHSTPLSDSETAACTGMAGNAPFGEFACWGGVEGSVIPRLLLETDIEG